jgi:hypothetical protein
VELDAVGAFLSGELPRLEDYEIDLILSPIFTPRFSDQAIFAGLLGADAIPRDQWPGLVGELATRPVRSRLVTPDGVVHAVPLREVTIERYVHRLRLEATIPESLFKLLDTVPAADRPAVTAIARSAVWNVGNRREILGRYLAAATGNADYNLQDALDLMNIVDTRKPADLISLLAGIPQWQEAIRNQIDVFSRSKPFFIDRLEEMHGGDRDQRPQDNVRIAARESELAFLGRLQRILERGSS